MCALHLDLLLRHGFVEDGLQFESEQSGILFEQLALSAD